MPRYNKTAARDSARAWNRLEEIRNAMGPSTATDNRLAEHIGYSSGAALRWALKKRSGLPAAKRERVFALSAGTTLFDPPPTVNGTKPAAARDVTTAWSEFQAAALMTHQQLAIVIGSTPEPLLNPAVLRWREALAEMAGVNDA